MEDKGKINLWSSLPWGKREEKEREKEGSLITQVMDKNRIVYKLEWLKFLSYAILYNTCFSATFHAFRL
jgi:hypothetical protein